MTGLRSLHCELIILIVSVISGVRRVGERNTVKSKCRLLFLPDCWYIVPMAKLCACDCVCFVNFHASYGSKTNV